MSTNPTPEVHPGIHGLDDLDLLRSDLIEKDLLDLPQGPVIYVDAEGVPVASTNAVEQIEWLGPRSARPYERWYEAVPSLIYPIALVDQASRLCDVPQDVATVVVLASTEMSPADIDLVRSARHLSEKAGINLAVLPLGATATRRAGKLNQIVAALKHFGPVFNYTSTNLPPLESPGPGFVVFFTGLSGSGKSTVARALTHHLIEEYELEVSLLDGDVVRRNLSHGLTFSAEDRNTNVRRIGWVAAEIAGHGGVAVASPIAPFDSTRRAVRQMVTERGGRFLLVHICTPLEECERRDRKGLYAKARAGAIPDFTGISSPYEAPEDPDLRLDTTNADFADLKAAILNLLEARGWLPSRSGRCRPTLQSD